MPKKTKDLKKKTNKLLTIRTQIMFLTRLIHLLT